MKPLGPLALSAAVLALPAAAQDSLSLVTNWGSDLYSSAYTIDWAERFSEEHGDLVTVDFVGGPEVTPAREQLTATRNGVFDVMFGAAGYYVGQVPEAYVLYATDMTPMEAREAGATDLLAEIYREKANMELLGWVAAGVGYHIWLKDAEVPTDETGLPDLTGLKIRSSPFYNAWLETMGATVINVPAPDIYSALERGVVDGAAWPGLGATDFGWQEFIGARVDPPVWQFDNLLLVNSDAWAALSPEAQEALKASVIALEEEAYGYYESLVEDERAAFREAGTESFELTGEAREAYVANATQIMWDQLQEVAPENYERLREAFGG